MSSTSQSHISIDWLLHKSLLQNLKKKMKINPNVIVKQFIVMVDPMNMLALKSLMSESMINTTTLLLEEWRNLFCIECGGILAAREWRKLLCIDCGSCRFGDWCNGPMMSSLVTSRWMILPGKGIHLICETSVTVSIDLSTQCQQYMLELMHAIILYEPNYQQCGNST